MNFSTLNGCQVARRLRSSLVVVALASLAAMAQAPTDIRVALVIGNSAYAGAAALVNPANDAAAMGATLKTLGFTVVELRDGSRAQMNDAVAKVRANLNGKQGIGVLYYAGHGLQVDFHNYMVPVDATLAAAGDVSRQTIDVASVIDAFKSAGNRMNILVLDACRDNPFAGQASGKGLAPLDAPSGTFLAFATAPGNVAEDGDALSGNGLYTGFLVKELQKPATRIEDVFKRVRLQVRQYSQGRQIPWESTSLEEDFFFNDGAKYTFRPEDLKRVADAAQTRQDQLRKDAQQLKEREQQQAAAKALEQLLAAENERLKGLETAAIQAQENERLKRLSQQEAREQLFVSERADWNRIKESRNVDEFYAFLKKYPSGFISEQAQFRLDQMQKAKVEVQVPANGLQALASGTNRYALGDEFVYDRIDGLTKVAARLTNRVTFANDDRVEFDGGQEIWDQMGGQLLSRFGRKDPAVLAVPAELSIGKRWRSAYTNTAPGGEKSTAFYEFKVVAFEEVVVPAGRFMAYKIERSGDLRGQGWYAVQTGTTWVDPVTMHPVRTDSLARRDGRITVFDSLVLVSAKRVPRAKS
jgi:hypothetical protein